MLSNSEGLVFLEEVGLTCFSKDMTNWNMSSIMGDNNIVLLDTIEFSFSLHVLMVYRRAFSTKLGN